MPGLVGFQTNMPRGWAEPQLVRMVESLRHEPFYTTGMWIDEAIGLYVGWALRTSVPASRMPLANHRGDVVLFMSAEDLVSMDQWFYDEKYDGEYGYRSSLMHACETDPAFPEGLNGRFHGVVVDRVQGVVKIVNDRYALHRLYYHQSKEAFYFAAEAKAILAVRPELRRLMPRSLGEFITCGCVLQNRTLFEGIHVLPGASKWFLRKGVLERKEMYFKPQDWEEQEPLSPEKYYQELRDVVASRVSRYVESVEPIAISLTGGLDTRIILSWLKPLSRSTRCYTFGSMFRDGQDVIVARKVARACGLPHEVIKVNEGFLQRFQYYAERTVYLTDGCADVRRSADLYLNERARNIAPIRLTGNYGSEVLRGTRAFKPAIPITGLYHDDLLSYCQQSVETYNFLLQGHPLSFAVFKQAPWHHYGLLALEQTQVSIWSPYLDNDLVRTVFRAPKEVGTTPGLSLRLIREGNPTLSHIPTDRGIGGEGLWQALEHHALEFLTKAEYAYDYGMPQWLARVDHILSPLHLERFVLGVQKFSHYRVWYQKTLSNYVREILLDPLALSRSHIQRSHVEAIVNGHLRGNRNYTSEIHMLLTLELLHRLFIDNN